MSSPPKKSPSPKAASPAPAPGSPEQLEPDVLAAEVGDNDNDSAYDGASMVSSGSTSMASSVARYRLENGRTYHSYKEGSYILPNDQVENDRLDLQHNLCTLTMGDKLFLCDAGKEKPIQRVLDAGCGTGIWAMDFADEHPEAEVQGVDLSPIQPSFVPPNVAFYVDDLEAEWAYNHPFDFVYMRMLSASIQDWPGLFKQAYQNMTPGGFIELLDPIYPMESDDGTLTEDSALYRWSKELNDAAAARGSSLDAGLSHKDKLIHAGFVNVREVTYKWPMNTWPRDPYYKEIGAWAHENIMQGLQALSLAVFTRVGGWSREELELFLVDVRRDLMNTNIHAYWRIMVVYGQKPE